MKGVSRNTLRALDADAVETADLRPAQIARLQHVSGEVLDTIQEVFAGTSLPEDQGRVAEVLQARRAVTEAWDKARANFVEIGVTQVGSFLRRSSMVRNPPRALR